MIATGKRKSNNLEGIELGWISLVVALVDFLTGFYILKIAGFPPEVCAISSAVLNLSLFSFRAFEIEYLRSVKKQLSRSIAVFIASSILLFPFISPKLVMFLFSIALMLPFVNFVFFRIALLFIPRRVFIVDAEDFEDLSGILREIEEKSFGKIIFKPANPHLSEYPSNVIAITSQDQPAEMGEIRLSDLAEKVLKRIPLEIIERFKDEYRVIFSNIKEPAYKRILDLVTSVIGLILFSPLMALISILIIVEDGFPVIFKQERVGKNGKIFVMYKFRSMRNRENAGGKFATEEDHRILKVGRFIRKFRFDEILQFINVLKGDMSVIGPRPEQKEFSEEFEKLIPHYRYRYSVRPGITGWAQLMYKYSSNIEETKIKLSYDLYYIKNMGLLLDLEIILKTLEVMLFRRGAR